MGISDDEVFANEYGLSLSEQAELDTRTIAAEACMQATLDENERLKAELKYLYELFRHHEHFDTVGGKLDAERIQNILSE